MRWEQIWLDLKLFFVRMEYATTTIQAHSINDGKWDSFFSTLITRLSMWKRRKKDWCRKTILYSNYNFFYKIETSIFKPVGEHASRKEPFADWNSLTLNWSISKIIWIKTNWKQIYGDTLCGSVDCSDQSDDSWQCYRTCAHFVSNFN